MASVQWVLTEDGTDQLAKAYAGLITSVPQYFTIGEAGYTTVGGQNVPVNPDPTLHRILSQGTELNGLTTFTNGSAAVTGVGTNYTTSLTNGKWIKPDVNQLAVASEAYGTGDGSTLTFAHTAADLPVNPSSVTITAGAVSGTDNGAGVISGAGITGTINYATGAVSVTFTVAPAPAQAITMAYVQKNVSGLWYQILSITDDTHLTLTASFSGVSSVFGGEATSWAILPYFIFEKFYVPGDVLFQGVGTGLTTVNNLVNFLEANSTQLAAAPEFFEIGVWDNNGVMIAYGTFPEEIKTVVKIINNIANVQM